MAQVTFSKWLFANALSVTLFALFFLFLIGVSISGYVQQNEELVRHGEEQVSVLQYMDTSQFWFESFQNWQSEFLAVGALLVLSIFLRQRGSPESKVIGEPNSQTGNEG